MHIDPTGLLLGAMRAGLKAPPCSAAVWGEQWEVKPEWAEQWPLSGSKEAPGSWMWPLSSAGRWPANLLVAERSTAAISWPVGLSSKWKWWGRAVLSLPPPTAAAAGRNGKGNGGTGRKEHSVLLLTGPGLLRAQQPICRKKSKQLSCGRLSG